MCPTLERMSTITFRSDAAVDRALSDLTSDGTDRSQAIREAILTAREVRRAEELRAEARALVADSDDRAEMRAVLTDMESLRAW